MQIECTLPQFGDASCSEFATAVTSKQQSCWGSCAVKHNAQTQRMRANRYTTVHCFLQEMTQFAGKTHWSLQTWGACILPTPDMTGDMAPWGMPMLPCPMPMWGRGCPGMAPEYAYPGGLMACCSTQMCKLWTSADYTSSVVIQICCDDCKGCCVAQPKV